MPVAQRFFLAWYGHGFALRRGVWQPLHRMMGIFHYLPLTGAVILFLLLAVDGQLRELYLSYLEDLENFRFFGDLSTEQNASTLLMYATAAIGFGLVSAALFEAHYWLSTMRINVIYSSVSNPDAVYGSRNLQRSAAIILAFVPWIGLATGLLYAREYLAKLEEEKMGHLLPTPSAGSIVLSTVVLGIAAAAFRDRYRQSGLLQSVFAIGTPLAAAVLAYFLADVSVTQWERISSYVWTGFVAISAAYYLSYHWLFKKRGNIFYSYSPFRGIVADLRRRQRIALFAWTSSLWIGIGIYFAIASHSTPHESQNFLLLSRWAFLPLAATWAIAIGLLVTMFLDRFRECKALPKTIIILIGVLMVAALIVSRDVNSVIWLYRLIGPLGSMAFAWLFVFSAFTLIAVLSQKSGFPALTLVVVALVISAIFPISIFWTFLFLSATCLLLAIMAVMSRLWAVALVAVLMLLPGINALTWKPPSPYVRREANARPLKEQFRDWLNDRTKGATNGDRYPVLIIAVEGGGLYAATAASLMLARLQDGNKNFSKHVFAISGVSGGAIGATVFQVLNQSRGNSHPTQELAPMVERIMEGDFFSPVVGALFPEFLLRLSQSGRERALAGSFAASVEKQDSGARAKLDDLFAKHWTIKKNSPALVLNTTWVETGFRVAFAPFSLRGIEDTLYSFSDAKMPNNDDVTLIDAAVISARFPGILPPYSVSVAEEKKVTGRRSQWNFVDGGYVDSSGADTAVALYRALTTDKDIKRRADIRVLLLTSAAPEPNLSPENRELSGTVFRDTLAPITAIMKVRDNLAIQAVARACYEVLGEDLKQNPEAGKCVAQAREAKMQLQIIEIDDQFYNLPLGWKLSRTSLNVIKQLVKVPDGSMVTPKTCAGLKPAQEINSCILADIESFLKQ